MQKLISEERSDNITIFLQWCIVYGNVKIKNLSFYQHYFLLNVGTTEKRDEHKIIMYHLGNTQLKHDASTQCDDNELTTFAIMKENHEIPYLIMAKACNRINKEEEEKLLAFTTNVYLLSPQTYRFLKRLMPSLYACSTIYEHYSPRQSYLKNLLTWHGTVQLKDDLENLHDFQNW